MNKRRVIVWLFALVLILGLVACNGGTEPSAEVSGETSEDLNESSEVTTEESQVEGNLKDGTYTSNQQGHNGPIEYEVTIEGGKIEAIKVVQSYETVGVSDKALYGDLPEKIIESQSTGVDSITGATISSGATKRAVEDAIDQAGGNGADYRIAEEKESPKEIEAQADIIIIGGGGAGLSAATTALEEGVKVLIIEKSGYLGGNTMVAGGIYNAPNPTLQDKEEMTAGLEAAWEEAINEEPISDDHADLQAIVKKQYEDWKVSGSTTLLDSKEWYALQTWNGGDKVAELDLVKLLAFNSYDEMKWLEELGWEYDDFITTGAGSMYPRTHKGKKPLGTGFIDAYTEQLEGNENCTIYYETRATKLIQDDNGKVVGVEAEDLDGNTYTFTADKGVILSTGGFAGNQELVQEYNTSGIWPDLSGRQSSNLPAIEGDGIKLAEEVNAQLVDMDQIQLLFTTEAKTGQVNLANFKPNGTAGYIFVNQEGERFVREDGRRDEISLGMIDQTGEIGYMVQSASSGNIDLETGTDLGGVPLKDLIDQGLVFYGESLEDAAEAAEIPYEALKATIDSYNEKVDSQAEEDEFGRRLFTHKLEGEGWYIVPRSPAIHHTMGGVKIDVDNHVIDTNGKIIPGFYAAGEVTGGIHGANRLGGNALVETVVFGRNAVRSMLKDNE